MIQYREGEDDMDNRRGWWYLLSLASIPFLFLAHVGLFGKQAREESDVAVSDWVAYGRVLLVVLAAIVVGVVIGLAVR
jgi:hypothetical protein